MNEDFIFPKSGPIFAYEKFPKLTGISFTIGFAKSPSIYCTDGYDKPPTHRGYDAYFFVTIFNRQLTLGYKYVKEIKEVVE